MKFVSMEFSLRLKQDDKSCNRTHRTLETRWYFQLRTSVVKYGHARREALIHWHCVAQSQHKTLSAITASEPRKMALRDLSYRHNVICERVGAFVDRIQE